MYMTAVSGSQGLRVECNWARQTTCLKSFFRSYSHETVSLPLYESKIEFSALSHVACWDGDSASGGSRGGALFESLNLYGLLQYQALRTRSDSDTFVEGWQISCPSRCLIAWPLFTKWWWWRGVTALSGACFSEGLHCKCTIHSLHRVYSTSCVAVIMCNF